MEDDVLKQTYIGKLTMGNTLVYNHSTLEAFESNEFITIGESLYGSIYFRDIKSNIIKKAWVLAMKRGDKVLVLNNNTFFQIYQDETATKKVSIADIFANPRSDGYLEQMSPPPVQCFNSFIFEVLSGGSYGGAAFRCYPIINGKPYLAITQTSTSAVTGTTYIWANAIDTGLDLEDDDSKAEFVRNAAILGKFTTTGGNGASYAGVYYGQSGTNPETVEILPDMIKFKIDFTNKYQNGSYYQPSFLLARSESANSNTYYMGNAQGNVRKNTFTVDGFNYGSNIENPVCIEGLIAIPWASSQTNGRAGTKFKISLADALTTFSTEISVSSYKGYYICVKDNVLYQDEIIP